MNKYTFRAAAALVGASAVVTMGALSAAAGPTQVRATNTIVPEHYGGPINTTVYAPTATVGVPTSSSSAPAP